MDASKALKNSVKLNGVSMERQFTESPNRNSVKVSKN